VFTHVLNMQSMKKCIVLPHIVLTALNIKIASLIDIEVVVRRKNAFVFMLPDPSMVGMEIDYISLVFIFSIVLIYRFYFYDEI